MRMKTRREVSKPWTAHPHLLCAVELEYNMNAQLFETLDPFTFHRTFFLKGLRADGRQLTERRSKISGPASASSQTTSEGSGVCRIGETSVLAAIKTEVGTPGATTSDSGRATVTVTSSPLAGSRYQIGRANDEIVLIGQTLQQLLDQTHAIDLTQLCVLNGQTCFVLYIDVVILSDDGNLYDACVGAMMAALQSCLFPLGISIGRISHLLLFLSGTLSHRSIATISL